MVHLKLFQCVFIIFVIVISNAQQTQLSKTTDDGVDNLPADFMNFVKDLDSMVFQSERKNLTFALPPSRPPENNKKRMPKKLLNRRRNDYDIRSSQSAAIRDILMLKLVSYYEDKYNVGGTRIYTTPQMLEPLGTRRKSFRPVERRWNDEFIETTSKRTHDPRKYTQTPPTHDASSLDVNRNVEHTTKSQVEEVVGLR